MSKLKTFIAISIFLIIALITIYDIILVRCGYTISEVLRDWGSLDGWWIAPWYGSMFIGHWWINIWSTHNWWTTSWHKQFVLVLTVVLLLLLNLTIMKDVFIPWYITIPGGLCTGALLWPQLKKKK